jgi:hypothetical protein
MGWSHLWSRLRREIGRYRRSIPKLRALRWSDWKDLARAQWALARAQRELKRLPTGGMVGDNDAPSDSPDEGRIDDARRIALAVNRAAAFGVFRPRCLVKSRALRKLLELEGIKGARVLVGVQLFDGQFRAHAWVEYHGQVVGDDLALVAQFVPMPGLVVAELR